MYDETKQRAVAEARPADAPQKPKSFLHIEGDLAVGEVTVSGHVDDMRLVYWLLGEAKRLCEQRADQRDAKRPHITVAQRLPGSSHVG